MTAAVDVDLAASILAMWQLVRGQLAVERPQLADVAGQASAAFDRTRDVWHALTGEACHELAKSADADYGEQLAQVVDDKAAEGVAEGMGILLDRGWNPEVAWQKVLSGYGLDARRMRGLVAGVMPTPNASGAVGKPDALGRTAVRALLAYAETLAGQEVSAWSHAHEEIAKAHFNPYERRDASGQWTRDPTLVRTKQREVDPLAGVGVEDDRYAALEAQGDPRYAALEGDRYDALRYDALQADARTAAADPRYAALEGDRYDALRYDALREPEKQAAGTRRVIHHHFIMTMGNTKMPGEKEPEAVQEDPRERHTPKNYLPMSALNDYYDHLAFNNADVGSGLKNPINFSQVRMFREGWKEAVQNDPSLDIGIQATGIKLQSAFDPFEVASEDKDATYVDPQVWREASQAAYPLWHEAFKNAEQMASLLEDREVQEFATWAGYSDKASIQMIRDQIPQDAYDFHHNAKHYDGSLLEAMCDYVTWYKPKLFVPLARRAYPNDPEKQDDMESQAQDLRAVMSRMGTLQQMQAAGPPSILSFRGLHDADYQNRNNISGTYVPVWVRYRSAISELGENPPDGIFGLREIKVRPDTRV
jgi:hypothetical protein